MGEASHGLRKFFVTNLLERCSSLEIGESSVFLGRDIKDLEGRMKGVKMGESKLLVNIAKVTVENSGYSDQSMVRNNLPSSFGQVERNNVFNLRDCRSYSDVLGKPKGVGDFVKDYGGSKGAGMATAEKSIVVPDRTLAFKELLGLAMIGRMVDLEPLLTSTGS
ncbi:hypothetical protein Hanom_Chr02g00105831 [Helianthus anomalus]